MDPPRLLHPHRLRNVHSQHAAEPCTLDNRVRLLTNYAALPSARIAAHSCCDSAWAWLARGGQAWLRRRPARPAPSPTRLPGRVRLAGCQGRRPGNGVRPCWPGSALVRPGGAIAAVPRRGLLRAAGRRPGGLAAPLAGARPGTRRRQRCRSPEVAALLSRARVELERAGRTGDLGAAPSWETSNRQARKALLGLLSDHTDGSTAAE